MAVSVRASAAKAAVKPARKVQSLKSIAQTAAVSVASLALTMAAHADATVKLGSDNGSLAFEPSSVTIKAGGEFIPSDCIDRDVVTGSTSYLNEPNLLSSGTRIC